MVKARLRLVMVVRLFLTVVVFVAAAAAVMVRIAEIVPAKTVPATSVLVKASTSRMVLVESAAAVVPGLVVVTAAVRLRMVPASFLVLMILGRLERIAAIRCVGRRRRDGFANFFGPAAIELGIVVVRVAVVDASPFPGGRKD